MQKAAQLQRIEVGRGPDGPDQLARCAGRWSARSVADASRFFSSPSSMELLRLRVDFGETCPQPGFARCNETIWCLRRPTSFPAQGLLEYHDEAFADRAQALPKALRGGGEDVNYGLARGLPGPPGGTVAFSHRMHAGVVLM